MLKYKLTNWKNMTRNDTLWGEGVTHETDGSGELCGPGWLHFYHSAELAVILNPMHANFLRPKLWECSADGKFKDDRGLKGGCTRLTTLREIPLPKITEEQKIRFGIMCAQKISGGRSEIWDEWAEEWLSGKDRSITSTYTAYSNASSVNSEYAARAARGSVYSCVYAARAADTDLGLDFQAIALEALRGN
jgi:hypothetical protein